MREKKKKEKKKVICCGTTFFFSLDRITYNPNQITMLKRERERERERGTNILGLESPF